MHGLHRRLLLLLLLLASGRLHGPGQVRQAAATGLLVVLLLRAGSTPPLPHRPIFAATSTSLPLRVAASRPESFVLSDELNQQRRPTPPPSGPLRVSRLPKRQKQKPCSHSSAPVESQSESQALARLALTLCRTSTLYEYDTFGNTLAPPQCESCTRTVSMSNQDH
jgi:hypothetical protein